MPLREYQDLDVDQAEQAVRDGQRALVVAPPGSGKTHEIAELMCRAYGAGKRVVLLTPRREIVVQSVDRFVASGVARNQVGVLMGADTHNLYAPIQIVCWPTLVRRAARSLAALPLADLLLVDEAHLAVSRRMLERVLEHYRNKMVVGFTATPLRASGVGLGSYFDVLIQNTTVSELQEQGHLVPTVCYGGKPADLQRIRTVCGDFHQKELAVRCDTPQLVGEVKRHWLEHGGDRQTILFATSVGHANSLLEQFVREGVSAECVTAKTPEDERDELMRAFRAGETQMLVNVGVATYGLNIPSVSCIVLARPTKSCALHVQMIGRGLRPADGKQDCLILDHGGNIERNGFPEEDYPWSLDLGTQIQNHKEFKDRVKKRKTIECQDCHYLFRGSRTCSRCGWKIPVPKRNVAYLETDLVQITKERRQSLDARKGFYLELCAIAELRGYKSGWAKVNYKEKFGNWPSWSWDDLYQQLRPIEPSPATLRWVQSRMIRYAKRRKTRPESAKL